MKKYIVLAFLTSSSLFAQSKKITTASYDNLMVSGAFRVELVLGKEGAIEVSGSEKALAAAIIECENNVLKIYHKGHRFIGPVSVKVPVESLNSVTLSGSGKIFSGQMLKTESFEANLSGSGDIDLLVEASKTDTRVSGSGKIKLKGSSASLSCNISGSGKIETDDLSSQKVSAYISGSGKCRINCDGPLSAYISGSGKILYRGQANIVEKNINGSGDLERI